MVPELSSKGLEFERYDQDPIKTDESGIAHFGDDRVAWLKGPDSNILAIGPPEHR